MDLEDSPTGNLFFAAGRAAASRGWFDAVLVTGSDVLNVAPVGPPVVVVAQGAGLDLKEAKALASASGAGRRILVAHAESQPIRGEALPWIGKRIDIEDLADSRGDTDQVTNETEAYAETGTSAPADDSSNTMTSESPGEGSPVPETLDKGPEADADRWDAPAAESVTPSAIQETSSVGAEPLRRMRTGVLAAVAAVVALAALGVWWVVDGKDRTENSPSVSPAASGPQGDDRGFFDTASAERQSVDYLTDELSASKPEVSVRCPKDAPISAGSFTCSITIGTPGDEVTGKVTYTLVQTNGDALRMRGDYQFH